MQKRIKQAVRLWLAGYNSSSKQRRRSQRGMTLVEIMVVVVIISLVMGVAGVAVFGQLQKAQIEVGRTQMMKIAESLDLYRLSYRKYPSTGEGLAALTQSKGGQEPIMREVPRDPWDNEYIYIFPGQHNPKGFDIVSYGPDGVAGGGDDIGNWSEPTQ